MNDWHRNKNSPLATLLVSSQWEVMQSAFCAEGCMTHDYGPRVKSLWDKTMEVFEGEGIQGYRALQMFTELLYFDDDTIFSSRILFKSSDTADHPAEVELQKRESLARLRKIRLIALRPLHARTGELIDLNIFMPNANLRTLLLSLIDPGIQEETLRRCLHKLSLQKPWNRRACYMKFLKTVWKNSLAHESLLQEFKEFGALICSECLKSEDIALVQMTLDKYRQYLGEADLYTVRLKCREIEMLIVQINHQNKNERKVVEFLNILEKVQEFRSNAKEQYDLETETSKLVPNNLWGSIPSQLLRMTFLDFGNCKLPTVSLKEKFLEESFEMYKLAFDVSKRNLNFQSLIEAFVSLLKLFDMRSDFNAKTPSKLLQELGNVIVGNTKDFGITEQHTKSLTDLTSAILIAESKKSNLSNTAIKTKGPKELARILLSIWTYSIQLPFDNVSLEQRGNPDGDCHLELAIIESYRRIGDYSGIAQVFQVGHKFFMTRVENNDLALNGIVSIYSTILKMLLNTQQLKEHYENELIKFNLIEFAKMLTTRLRLWKDTHYFNPNHYCYEYHKLAVGYIVEAFGKFELLELLIDFVGDFENMLMAKARGRSDSICVATPMYSLMARINTTFGAEKGQSKKYKASLDEMNRVLQKYVELYVKAKYSPRVADLIHLFEQNENETLDSCVNTFQKLAPVSTNQQRARTGGMKCLIQ